MAYNKKILLLIIISILISSSCSKDVSQKYEKKVLTIAAASSLTLPMNDIIENFKKNNPSYDVILNYASSGSILKQIQEGAPIDIFLSASNSQFDSLIESNLILKDNSKLLLSNSMVLITYRDKVNLNDNTKFDFINYNYSIGDPNSVPAGKYSYEIMQKLNIWKKNNVNQITAKSVKQVLSYVESKNVDFGIVYNTDALNNKNVEVIYEFPDNLHSSISYPIGIIETSNNDNSKFLYDYITSDDSIEIFKSYGFKKIN